MQKAPIRKILSVVLFFGILVFTYLLLKKINSDEQDFLNMIYAGGIFFFDLFLFLLVFKRATTVKKEKVSELPKKEKTRADAQELKEQKQREQMEKHVLAILSDIQKQNEIKAFAESLLTKFSKEFSVVQGIVYVREENKKIFHTAATYALYGKKDDFVEGIGINGQVAINKKPKLITELPEGYITVISGLGSSSPNNLLILPFVYNGKTIALTELASFDDFPKFINEIYQEINNSIAEKFKKLNQ